MTVEIFATSENWFMSGTDYHHYCDKLYVMQHAETMKKRSLAGSCKNVKIYICNPCQWTQEVCEMDLKKFNKWAELNCQRVL